MLQLLFFITHHENMPFNLKVSAGIRFILLRWKNCCKSNLMTEINIDDDEMGTFTAP
jgi:hypothetical protein